MNTQCLRPAAGAGHPCRSNNPFTLSASEPTVNSAAGNPVNLATGNKYLEAIDLPLRKDGLLLMRSYNAQDQTDVGLGVGWRHNFSMALTRTASGLKITQADGSHVLFNKRTGKMARAATPGYGWLTVADNGWVWHWSDRSTITFDRAGMLSALHVAGHHLKVQRYSRASVFADKIRRVSNSAGETLVFHYKQDPHARARIRLTGIDTPQGQIHYRYDMATRLVFATAYDGSQTRYAYESALQAGDPHKLTGLSIQPRQNPATLQNLPDPLPQGYRLRTWQYDQSGRVIRALLHDQPVGLGTQLFSYNSSGSTRRTTLITDGDGHRTRFVWRRINERLLLESVTGHGCIGCATPGLRATYDEQGRLSYVNGLHIARHPNGIPAKVSQPRGFWPGLQLHYDQLGRRTAWRSMLTGQQQIQYNHQGQPDAQQFANGVRWHYEYDAMHRLRTIREEATVPASSAAERPRHLHQTRTAITRSATVTTTTNSTATASTKITIDYTDQGGFLLTHPNETQSQTPIQSGNTLRIGFARAVTADNPYPIHYEDVIVRYRLPSSLANQEVHLLPEGGRLIYTYSPQHQLRSIVWEDAKQKQHRVLDLSGSGGALFGNRTLMQYRQTASGRQQLHVVAPAPIPAPANAPNNTHINANIQVPAGTIPIVGLERQTDRNGLVLREDYYLAPAARAMSRHYFYGQQQRMAGMIEQQYRYPKGQLWRAPTATSKRRHWYAWDRSGASLARFDGKRTQRRHIHRDASGLPQQVDDLTLRYGTNQRLTHVYRQGQSILHNLHNGLGLRIARRDPHAFTHFYYRENRVVGQWTIPQGSPLRHPVNGAISRRYIYAGPIAVAFIEYARPAAFTPPQASTRGADASITTAGQLRRVLVDQPAATLYFIHTDTQGLPLAVTDSRARPVWLAVPEPTGKFTPIIAQVQLPLRYPGQYEDTASGWFDNIYRTYDPDAGHYLEPDPLGPIPGTDPLGYAAAQPRRYIDPLGLLLFAFDGTRNQGSESNSNVYKLQKVYASGSVHYIGGPGTRDGLSAFAEPAVYGASNPLQSPYVLGPLGVLLRPLDTLVAESVDGIVRTQMHRLIDTLLTDAPSLRNANGHIPIDVIGFSRGAAAARIFANQLLKHMQDGLFSVRVQTPLANNGNNPNAFMTVNACLDLRFMGLFDTVTQLGALGANNAAYNYDVSPAWHWVAHAIALNEHNNLFPLTTIGNSEQPRFHEIGFMGNHSDMGGTIQTADTTHVANPSGLPGDLGNVVLQWMYQQGQAAGVSWQPLPASALRIRNPLVHNNRMDYEWQDPSRTALAQDREMELASREVIRQHQSPAIGRSKRMQVERFIRRDLPSTRPLSVADVFYGNMMVVAPGKEITLLDRPIVGRADIQAYARWLQETTGFKLQTGQVW